MKKLMLIVVSALVFSACTPAAKSGEADSTAVAVDSVAVEAGTATQTTSAEEAK